MFVGFVQTIKNCISKNHLDLTQRLQTTNKELSVVSTSITDTNKKLNDLHSHQVSLEKEMKEMEQRLRELIMNEFKTLRQ